MGISKLETFLEEGNPNEYCKQVNIFKLAEEYNRFSRNEPVLVIDGTYFINHFYFQVHKDLKSVANMYSHSIFGEYSGNYIHSKYVPQACMSGGFTRNFGPDVYGNMGGVSPPMPFTQHQNVKHEGQGGFKRDFLCGGQLNAFKFFIKSFVNILKERGIKVVFYFDGPTKESMFEKRKQRINWKVTKRNSIFENLERKVLKQLYGYFILPTLMSTVGRFIIKYECDCDVYVSVNDCDNDLAAYAYREGSFAILSQDTDFMCMQNAKYYFSIKHLNLETMTTLNYDRIAFMNYLGLNSDQMRLFATLMGNDIVSQMKLKQFHKKLSEAGNDQSSSEKCKHIHQKSERYCVKDLVKKLAKYVCEMTKDRDVEQSLEDVISYVSEIRGNDDLNKNIADSLESYQPRGEEHWMTRNCTSTPWNDVLALAYERHIRCEAIPDVYSTITGQPYEIALVLEKRTEGAADASRIFLPLRQRIYGVLLHEIGLKHVEEFGFWDNKWHDPQQFNVTDVDLDVHHPGLLTLWMKKSRCVELQRWVLFARSISPKLDPALLQNLNYHYVVPVAVLFYLKHEWSDCNLTEDEINAFIKQAVTLQWFPDNNLQKPLCEVPTAQVVNVSTLMSCGINTVLFLMSALGFPLKNAMPWFYFEGPLFYKFLKTECIPLQRAPTEDFNIIKHILNKVISPVGQGANGVQS